MSRIVVPWSGGLDSTYCLLKALDTGAQVTTFSVNYGVDSDADRLQAKARSLLRSLIGPRDNWWHFDPVHDFIIKKSIHKGFGQVLPNLLSALYHVNFDVETEIWLGYCADDELLAINPNVRHQLQHTFDSMVLSASGEPEHKTLIHLPLASVPKSRVREMFSEFSSEYPLASLTWSCAYPQQTYGASGISVEACGRCDSCLKDPVRDFSREE